MHHKATITPGTAFGRPFHVSCSCGTGGDFRTESDATNWIQSQHFARLGGVSTMEIHVPPGAVAQPVQVEEPKKKEEPAEPEKPTEEAQPVVEAKKGK